MVIKTCPNRAVIILQLGVIHIYGLWFCSYDCLINLNHFHKTNLHWVLIGSLDFVSSMISQSYNFGFGLKCQQAMEHYS